nr:MAG TPA: hypothetical protein [Caudoviricetes sp.]
MCSHQEPLNEKTSLKIKNPLLLLEVTDFLYIFAATIP